ncbi:MAG: hypothetical protein WCO69_03950 [Candidatus Omnitrophota bacterium]
MAAKKKVILNWSGGKDCTHALHVLQQSGRYDVVGLLEIAGTHRNLQHGIPHALIQAQADSLGLPLFRHIVTWDTKSLALTRNAYRDLVIRDPGFHAKLQAFKKLGVAYLAGGDIDPDSFQLRVKVLAQFDSLKALCPLICPGLDHRLSGEERRQRMRAHSLELAHRFIKAGFKALVVKVNLNTERGDQGRAASLKLLGRDYNGAFLSSLDSSMDPCGEFYEFHTFVYDGPGFRKKVDFTKGPVRYVSEMDYGMQAMLDLSPKGLPKG